MLRAVNPLTSAFRLGLNKSSSGSGGGPERRDGVDLLLIVPVTVDQ